MCRVRSRHPARQRVSRMFRPTLRRKLSLTLSRTQSLKTVPIHAHPRLREDGCPDHYPQLSGPASPASPPHDCLEPQGRVIEPVHPPSPGPRQEGGRATPAGTVPTCTRAGQVPPQGGGGARLGGDSPVRLFVVFAEVGCLRRQAIARYWRALVGCQVKPAPG